MKKLLDFLRKAGEKLQLGFYLTYFTQLTKAVLMAIPVVTILILMVYTVIPKNSWICVYSTPYDFRLYEATDIYYWEKTDNLDFFYNGKIGLNNICFMDAFDENQNLSISSGEQFYITFEYSSISQDAPCRLTFDLPVVFENDAIICHNCYPSGNIYLANNGVEYVEEDNDFKLIHTNTFTITKAVDDINNTPHYFSASINLDQPNTIKVEGDFSIWNSDGDCVVSSKECSSVILKTCSSTIFSASYEGVTSKIDWDSNMINVLTSCNSFDVMSGSKDDILQYTYLNKQTEYKIASVAVGAEACTDDSFDVNFKLANGSTELQLTGDSKNVTMALTTLAYSLPKFIAENVSSIIIGLFTAIVGAFVALAKDEFKKSNKNRNITEEVKLDEGKI